MYASCVCCLMAIATISAASAFAGDGGFGVVTDWRRNAESFASTTTSHTLMEAQVGVAATWEAQLAEGPASFSIKLPEPRNNPWMLTFQQENWLERATVTVEVSADSTNGIDGTWTIHEDTHRPRRFLDKVDINPDDPAWVRLTWAPWNGEKAAEQVRVTDLALFELTPGKIHDYWVVLGASIQAQSIRQSIFHRDVQERFPGQDPVIFNMAVGGWKSSHVRGHLEEFMAEHPFGVFFPIHIGGNNVSANRPYPGGAEELEEDLEDILIRLKADARVPILSRLSYRAYKSKDHPGETAPEEHGSGPYVENIYDPLITRYCAPFVDPDKGLGVVNAYDYFKKTQDWTLASDGIHVNREGEFAWNRLWVEGAGPVVYGRRALPAKQ